MYVFICIILMPLFFNCFLLCFDHSAANHMFQYFITIVPTKLNTYKVSAETHQYSVTERVRFPLCQYVCVYVSLL